MPFKIMNCIALTIVIIGAVNWGLIGFFQFDAVAWIFGGQDSVMSRILYVIIAIASVWCISLFFSDEFDSAKKAH